MSTPPIDDATSPPEGDEPGASSALEAIRDRLDREHLARLVKFGLVGGLGIGVNWIFFEFGFYLFRAFSDEVAATLGYVLGLIVSIFTNFVLNDVWTWGDRLKGGLREWCYRLGKYYVSASVAGVVQVGLSSLTLAWIWKPLGWRAPAWTLPGLGFDIPAFELAPRLGLLTGVAFGMIINFLASHLWAFQDAEIE